MVDIIGTFESDDFDITIYGNNKIPLFKANDIEKILEISNIRTKFKHIDESDKIIHKCSTTGGKQDITFLTEDGLYDILVSYRKPIAKTFRKWIYNVIKEIKQNESMSQTQPYIQTQSHINNTNHAINILEFYEKHVIYLIEIEQNIYKFGYTSNIKKRFTEHKTRLHSDIILIKCWDGLRVEIVREIERKIIEYTKNNKINSDYGKYKKEIIKTNDIGTVIELIDIWTKNCTKDFSLDANIELMKQTKELIEVAKNAGISGDKIMELISSRNTESIRKDPIKLKETKKKELPEVGIKCNRCHHTKIADDFGINPVSKQLFSLCIICRNKSAEKRIADREKRNEEAEQDLQEKMEKINKVREMSIVSTDLLKCVRCKKHKTTNDFGINKRTNALYKICTTCRGTTQETTGNAECTKCHKNFEAEKNLLTNTNYKTCGNCRSKDKAKDETNKKLIETTENDKIECSYCHKQFDKELNKKGNSYYKNCKPCRDGRKKYDSKKTEVHSEAINQQKREYYQKNKELIRVKQKEYYDSHKDL